MSGPTPRSSLAAADLTSQAASLPHAGSSSHALPIPHPADHSVVAAQIGTWEWHRRTQRVEWSSEADAIFGLPAGAFDGTLEGFLSRVHPVDRSELQTTIQTAMANRRPFLMEHRIILPDGTARWVSCRGQAMTEENGDLRSMAGTIEDISQRTDTERALRDLQQTLEQRVRERTTELEQTVRELKQEITRRQQTDAALRDSEQRYHALYEHNPSMYFTLAPDGAILSVNGFGAEELGYRPSELLGQSVLCVFQPSDHQTVLGQLIICAENPGNTFDWEIQKVRKDGRFIWVRERARAISDPQGRPIILVVCEDITDRRKTQEAMRESDARLKATTQLLHTLVRESPLPIVSLDADAKVTSWNQAATTLFGWTEEEVLGRELPYIPSGREAEAEALWNQGTHNMIRGPLALRRQRKDGTMIDLLLWPMTVYDENTALTTAIGLYVDQSDLQRAEEELRESASRFRAFASAMPDIAFVLDEHGRYVEILGHGDELLYADASQLKDRLLHEVLPQTDADFFLAIIRKTVETGQSQHVEYPLKVKAGVLWFEGHTSLMQPAPGKIKQIVWVAHNITERKQAEEALRESEARLQQAQAMAHLGNWEFNLKTNRLVWSDEIFRIFEIDQAQFGASYEAFLQAVHPDDRALVDDAYTRSVRNRTPYEIVHRLQMPDGRVKYVQERGETYYDDEGRPQRSVGTVQDITERRENQLQLQHSQALLNSMFEHLPNMLFVKDARTLRFVEFNKAGEDLTGFAREELLGKSDYDLFPREEADFFTEKDRAVLASGSMLEIPEEEIRTKHRGIRILQTKKLPLCDAHGTPQYLLGISEDITDRKQAEFALRESEQAIRELQEATSSSGLTLDQRIQTVLELGCRRFHLPVGLMTKVEEDRLVITHAWDPDKRFAPGMQLPLRDSYGRATLTENNPVAIDHAGQSEWRTHPGYQTLGLESYLGAKLAGEHQIFGTLCFVSPLARSTPFTPAEKDFLLLMARWVSGELDRHTSEQALRLSEQRYEIAFRSSPHPVVITELATGRCIEVNDTALQLFGFQRHEAVGHTTIAIELWPSPEDRTRFVTQLLANGTLRGVEFSFQTKDHRLRHCLVSSELIELNGTRCILTVGTDITEKKEAEAALRESEERWQRFVADAPVGLVIADADKRILSANKAYCTLTGYSEQEVINNTYALYTHPDDLPRNLQLTEEFFSGQRNEYTYEKRYVRKDGEIIWVSIRASRLTVHGYDAPLLLAVVEDITDRKQALADRERISQDLHDNILQSLYAVGMQLEAGKLLAGKAPRKSKQHVTQAVRQLNHLVLEVRQFITGLTRRAAPALDFSVALKQLVSSFSSENHATPALDMDQEAIASITPAIGEQLLNITREALSNSLRHATAAHRSVSLTRTDTHIHLRIADDGTGFDAARKRRRGHGLANMAARARTIRAQFTLESAPGRGTCIIIDVPTGGPHVR